MVFCTQYGTDDWYGRIDPEFAEGSPISEAIMNRIKYRAWDECPGVDDCGHIQSFLELVDPMVRDIQHLKAETIRARYKLSKEYDPKHRWITAVDILSNLDMPHYDSRVYQEYVRIYYDGGDPMSFKDFIDSMVNLAKGIDDEKY